MATQFILLLTTTVILATITLGVSCTDSGPLPRDCHLNQVKANPRNRHSFYWCLSDGPVLMKCLDSLIFSEAAGRCAEDRSRQMEISDEENLVDISDKKSKRNGIPSKDPSIKSPPPPGPPQCPAIDPPDHSILLPGSSCTEYYACSHGKAYPLSCPGNLHFNPTVRNCDFPYRAGCKKREEEMGMASIPTIQDFVPSINEPSNTP